MPWRCPGGTAGRGLGRALSVHALALGTLVAVPVAQDNEDCLECHAVAGLQMERGGQEVSLFVDFDRFDASPHGAMDCVMCHVDLFDVEEYPHEKDLERVDCTQCHDDDDGPINAWREGTHGRRALEGDERAPLCQDCHGAHYVVPLDEPGSSISPFRIPAMCSRCHGEGTEVGRAHGLSEAEAWERYRKGLHGAGLVEQGLRVTAVCTSCHGGHGVLPHDDSDSTIHADNVDGTCMECHGEVENVHRKVVARGAWEVPGAVPLCVECHRPHEERRVRYETRVADEDCLACHGSRNLAAGDGRSLFVDEHEHGRSVHGRNRVACAQCHSEASPSQDRACATIESRVDCSTCHGGEHEDFAAGIHGSLLAAGDPNAPSCTDCHGTHGILEHEFSNGGPAWLAELIRTSPTYKRNVPELCAECHREGGQAAVRLLGDEHHIVENYSMSIHGKGLHESGLTVTAVCTDCHTAHRELPPGDPTSSVNPENLATTCARCHDGILEQYEQSIHSSTGNPDYVQLHGQPHLPHCNDCHSAHEVARTNVADFQLGIMQQCGSCHAEIADTYFDSYHGKASALGETTRAKCFDCHAAHAVHPASDVRSTLHEANIVQTCATCHEGAHQEFTNYLAHADHHDRERYPILYWAFWGMTGLLVSVFAFFGLHTLVWLPRSWKLYRQHRHELAAIPSHEKHYMRFRPLSRALHITMIVSFFGLAITGMMLKFPDTGWARAIARLAGGVESAAIIHRLCAVVTFGYFAYHIANVIGRYRRGNKGLIEFLFGRHTLVPRWSDVTDFWATIKWFVGRGPMPQYGRWTYWEKFDYFAVFWGVMIIGLSGLVLWFPAFFTRFLPGWAINFATIIHSDEALLAVGFIFTIHFFNTHLRPEKFPMDPVIFTGRMRMKELMLERPAYYEELVASGELEERMVDPASPQTVFVARVVGFTALGIGVTLIVLIVHTLLAEL